MLACPAVEVYQHVILSRRKQAVDLFWAGRIASLPHMDKEGQQATFAKIETLSTSGKRLATAFERAGSDERRTEMIGLFVQRHGEAALRRHHPAEWEWLESRGVSVADAVAAREAAAEIERRNPFWE